MADACSCRRAMTMAFEEAALALGGVVASYPIPDEAVWDMARSLDVIHERACERCGGGVGSEKRNVDGDPHPAIVHLLAQLRARSIAGRGAGESDRGSR